jgi:pimeloyl-ACP methyl ester carboxylesterase
MTGTKSSSGCFKKLLQAVGLVLLAIVLLLTGLFINQNAALARTREQSPAPGKLVQVNGHLMHIHCVGSGSPTVVIDAGNGSFSVEWTPIQEGLRQVTRTCTYDRSGYGWSAPGPQPRDGMQVVSELHDLLQAAREPGPYLLVGHSLGGVHMRIYAGQYPGEVAGMVLIDTAYPLTISPEFTRQMRTSIGFYQVMDLLTRSGILRLLGPLGGQNSLPATARKLPPELQETYLNLLLDPAQYATAISEMEKLPLTFLQADQLMQGDPPLGDLPLTVLTAGLMPAAGSTPFNETYLPVPEQQTRLQLELARFSSQGEQRVIARSGHSVHLDAPVEVIRAIRDLIETIRK